MDSDKPIRRRDNTVIRTATSGYQIALGFEIAKTSDGGLCEPGPEGLQYCDATIVIPHEAGRGKTVEELTAEAWRRFDLVKSLL